MDLSKVKSGNDFLMQMLQDSAPEDVAPENVDNAGAEAANVDDTGLELVDDASPDIDAQSDAQVAPESDKSTDDLIDDWDGPSTDEPVTPTFDFKELGKALEIEGIESKDSLVNKVKEIITKSKELEQKAATFSSIPDPLREAIEVANRGGDYLEYLGISTIDYDALDDRTLVEEELINLGLFRKADGSVDEDSLSDYVNGIDDKEILVRGAQVRARFKYEQDLQKKAVQKKAEDQRNQAIKDLRESLDKTDAVGPFKLKPTHKKELYDTFVQGQMMKELFYNKEGKFDYSKAIKIYFKEKYGDKIDKFVAEAVKNQTKRQVVNDLKNVDLGNPSRIARPEVPTAEDPLTTYMRKLQGTK